MRSNLGETRSSVQRTHALICTDSHERITLPHWPHCETVHFASPAIGAKFSFFKGYAIENSTISKAPHGGIRFILLCQGTALLSIESTKHRLEPNTFAYIPSGMDHELELTQGAEVICLERLYMPLSWSYAT